MSGDWKVGDLAVCVDARPNPNCGFGSPITEGATYRVSGIGPVAPNTLFGPGEGLFLAGMDNPPLGYSQRRFRKILPDEPTACEEEFQILLNLSKQRVKA